ncbi:MAG: glucose-6-phosphate isomerase, partial [Bacteroidales bacterium]|nr:glucose-6-phosphate isomerase [Bacteroidales bacterium]
NELYAAWRTIREKKGAGKELTGWVDLPVTIDPLIIDQIESVSERLATQSQIIVVVGIGGSYLGSKAVTEALCPPLNHLVPNRHLPHIIYAGHHLSQDYHATLLEILDHYDYSVVVISKSGTTTEPAIAFRLLKAHLEKKYGQNAIASRIIAITDASKGALRSLTDQEGYDSFIVPDDIGGRYSVLTPVGLLPIALSGIDIRALLEGAAYMRQHCFNDPQKEENAAATYAWVRQALYHSGKPVEIMVNYEPQLASFGEWWKQLFGESEGKASKGIFPTTVNNTTDLHSMGQYIQEGLKVMFETVLSVNEPKKNLTIPRDKENLDNLNYLSDKTMHEVNQKAEQGTCEAHLEGKVPNIRIEIPQLTPWYIGQLIYFFEFSCAISSYMLHVNPFDQPGVEAYKDKMFRLLGKPTK